MNYTKDFRFIIAMVFFIIYATYFVFFKEFNSINCIYNKCTTYKQNGIFGIKRRTFSFSREDIERYEIGSKTHRTKHRHHYSYHTDYYPILVLKNGNKLSMPYRYCRDKYAAEEFALDAMSKRLLKKSEHPFGW